jgi:hypothetical protein
VSSTGEFFLTIPYADRNNVSFKVMADMASANAANPLPLLNLSLPTNEQPSMALSRSGSYTPDRARIPWYIDLLIGFAVAGLSAGNFSIAQMEVDVEAIYFKTALAYGGAEVWSNPSPLIGEGVATFDIGGVWDHYYYLHTFSCYLGNWAPIPSTIPPPGWYEGHLYEVPVYVAAPLPSVERVNGYSLTDYVNTAVAEKLPDRVEIAMDSAAIDLPENGKSGLELILNYHLVTYDAGADRPPIKLLVLDGSPIPNPPMWKPATWETAVWYPDVPVTGSGNGNPVLAASTNSAGGGNSQSVSTPGGQPQWDFNSQVVNDDMTLHAVWTAPGNVISLSRRRPAAGENQAAWDAYIANAEGWTYQSTGNSNVGMYVINGSRPVIVTGAAGTTAEDQQYLITINGNADVTLHNVASTSTSSPAIQVNSNQKVTLRLSGSNEAYLVNSGGKDYHFSNILMSKNQSGLPVIDNKGAGELVITGESADKGRLFTYGGIVSSGGPLTIGGDSVMWTAGGHREALEGINVTIKDRAQVRAQGGGQRQIFPNCGSNEPGYQGIGGILVHNALTIRDNAKVQALGAPGGAWSCDSQDPYNHSTGHRVEGKGARGIQAYDITIQNNAVVMAIGGSGGKGSGGTGIWAERILKIKDNTLVRAHGGNGRCFFTNYPSIINGPSGQVYSGDPKAAKFDPGIGLQTNMTGMDISTSRYDFRGGGGDTAYTPAQRIGYPRYPAPFNIPFASVNPASAAVNCVFSYESLHYVGSWQVATSGSFSDSNFNICDW